VRTPLSERFAGGLLLSLKDGYREEQHPRDRSGRWSRSGGGLFPSAEFEVEAPPGPPPKAAAETFEEEARRLSRTSGVRFERSVHADWRTEVVVLRAVADLPPGLRWALRETETKVRVVTEEDEPRRSFTVADRKFTKAGHADYRNNEVVVWEDALNRRVVQHECGHLAVKVLCGVVARNEARRRDLRGESEEEREEIRAIDGLAKALADFEEATAAEGGVTDYADSYVRDEERGAYKDVFEYQGRPGEFDAVMEAWERQMARRKELLAERQAFDNEMEGRRRVFEGQHGRRPEPGEDHEVDRLMEAWSRSWRESKAMAQHRYPYPKSGVSRAANENFAEIVGETHKGKGPGLRRFDERRLAGERPRTMRAFRRLWGVFAHRFDVPPVKEV